MTDTLPAVPDGFLVLRDDAMRLLESWHAPDPQQEQWRADLLAHCRANPGALWKQGPPQHLTTGAVVLNRTLDKVLLTLHAKAGMWLQFGGHFEPEDRSVHAAATRESREESGIADLVLDLRVVELHRHELLAPAFGRCAEHLDIRFAGVAPDEEAFAVSDESLDVAWWPADGMPEATEAELGPLVRAAQRLLADR
jgi:8-oxo-dGTP pyrophosphatase MutT (NUDIX family)